MEEAAKNDMINLTIDGKSISVPRGTTVYHAARQLGAEIPIFCYHDRMPPFGACRVCLVEVEKAPKLQTSCTLQAAEGMVVNTLSEKAVQGRKDILEFLLLNHPLDCPICDRGGECPLQENTLRYGPGLSRFFEEKRHFKKPYRLGPVLMLDRERCIVCARCTRFSDELSGDHALQFIDRGYRTEVGTPQGGPAESKFIGNTIMLCPVGALTSQVYRFRARPWDNTATSSTCTLCPIGCSMILDSRDGEIMRTRSQENKDVNDIWLCDKGWFGYEFTYHPQRLAKPLIRKEGKLEEATWEEAFALLAQKIQEAKPQGKLGALGGNPLTIEENYLFQKLMREGAGVNHLDHRIGQPILGPEEEGPAPGMEISIGECEQLNYIFLLGLDLTEEFPVIWLRLRQAIHRGAKVIYLGHYLPEINAYFSETYLHAPGAELEIILKHSERMNSFAVKGSKGAIFVGSQYLQGVERGSILHQLNQLRLGKDLSLNIMEGRGNSQGARLAGMRPDCGPLGQHVQDPGFNALDLINHISKASWDFLYVVGANIANKFPEATWIKVRQQLKFLVVQDLFLTETAMQADVVLPSLTFIEKGGSFLNIEGRIQTLLPGKMIPETLYSDAEIFTKIAEKLSLTLTIDPQFSEYLKRKKIALSSFKQSMVPKKRISAISDGELAASFSYTLFDRGIRIQHDEHLRELIKEPYARMNGQEASKRQIQDNDLIKISFHDKSITAKVRVDNHVADLTLVLPLGFPQEIPLQEFGCPLFNGLKIKLQKV